MLYRIKRPNAKRWNGLGGKFEGNETPLECVSREIRQESGINIAKGRVKFADIVTWQTNTNPISNVGGMYAYLIYLSPEFYKLNNPDKHEGDLEWKLISWACDKKNDQVVSNIPYFLPKMINMPEPLQHHCEYKVESGLSKVTVYPYTPPDGLTITP